MRKDKVLNMLVCVVVLLVSVAFSETIRPLLPANDFVAALARMAPTTIALLVCLNMIHLREAEDANDKMQEKTLDLIAEVIKVMDRMAEDNEKTVKKVNEIIERYKALHAMITEEQEEDDRILQENDQD